MMDNGICYAKSILAILNIIESSNSGFLPKRSLLVNTKTFISSDEAHAFDVDSDGEIIDRSTLRYATNTGTNINPVYNDSIISTETVQCKSSFAEIAIVNKGDLSEVDRVNIKDIALLDIDGDNDLDLFSYLSADDLDMFSTSGKGPSIIASTPITVYSENVGSLTNPLFAPGTINAFGLNIDAPRFGDASDIVFRNGKLKTFTL